LSNKTNVWLNAVLETSSQEQLASAVPQIVPLALLPINVSTVKTISFYIKEFVMFLAHQEQLLNETP